MWVPLQPPVLWALEFPTTHSGAEMHLRCSHFPQDWNGRAEKEPEGPKSKEKREVSLQGPQLVDKDSGWVDELHPEEAISVEVA